jgi:O-antigen/teichoic acid export membrane protein
MTKGTYWSITKIFNLFRSDQLIWQSSILFSGSVATGFGSYLFQLFMGRMLTVEAFGELESLLAASAIISVPAATVAFVATKYTASFDGSEQLGKVRVLFERMNVRIVRASIPGVFAGLIVTPFIARYLNLPSLWPVILLLAAIPIAFFSAASRGILTGLQRFLAHSVSTTIESFTKVGVSVLLVWLSWGLYGALGALIVSALVGYGVSLYPLRQLRSIDANHSLPTEHIRQSLVPTFFVLLSMTFLFNADMILVKHYLSQTEAGYYGALTIIGRIIFFLAAPIIGVLIPMGVRTAAQSSERARALFLRGALFVGGIGSIGALVYTLFPRVVILLLDEGKYSSITPLLGAFALLMMLYSLIQLSVSYALAFHRYAIGWVVVSGVILEAVLIGAFHRSLTDILWILGGVFGVICIASLWYATHGSDAQGETLSTPTQKVSP